MSAWTSLILSRGYLLALSHIAKEQIDQQLFLTECIALTPNKIEKMENGHRSMDKAENASSLGAYRRLA
jgi:hypothetical protein